MTTFMQGWSGMIHAMSPEICDIINIQGFDVSWVICFN